MRLSLALGVALAGLTMAAYATPGNNGPAASLDADGDGWVSRAEASAAFERMFDRMDGNDDSRLTSEDRHAAHAAHAAHVGGGEHRERVVVIHRGAGGGATMPEIDTELEGIDEDNCTRTVEGEGDRQRVTVICNREAESGEGAQRHERAVRRAERHARRAERHAERAEHHGEHREMMVMHGGGMGAMPMMLMLHSGEADANNDGALSRDEFRAQHLRFFDAADVNGDGRVRLPAPRHAEAPPPPAPPAPPAPPRPR